jgi:16S rRNA (adenine1518-N6/adenine1519-N6)-dimethyltransferase
MEKMTKKYLGQNFLFDPSILSRIVGSADVGSDDLIVEIGPGPGKLTRMLAERAGRVVAIEIDDKLYEKLKGELAGFSNIELIRGDALKYHYEDLPEFKVVANIPYYITTPLIFRLLDVKGKLKSMTLAVQKEVAERIVAKPGTKAYGVLSLVVQYHAEPSLRFLIPKEAFRPVPKVDSAIVILRILDKPSVGVGNEKLFFRIIKTAFSQRRKMLSNSLKSVRQDVKEWLIRAGIDPHRRPETLNIEEFARLANTCEGEDWAETPRSS